MSWFLETRERHSAKNGLIRARRDFGKWNVSVANCGQSSPYLNRMWNAAFEKLSVYAGNQHITSVLMLGLGAGGEVAKVHKRYPSSTLTVIEYDEEMIAFAKELKLYKPAPFPHVICADAALAVPQLSQTYDLIIVDLFKGPTPSPLSADPIFLQALETKLSDTGFMLVNVYQENKIFAHIAKKFLPLAQWKFEWNHIGLFTKNVVSKAMEEGYTPVREWPDFDPLLTMSEMHGSYVHAEKMKGLYWRFGPFSFEKYYGNEEPILSPLPKEKVCPIRVIMWQRRTNTATPKKWIAFGGAISQKIGFLRLDDEYTKHWSGTAKRYYNKWKREFQDSVYTLEEVSYDEFAEAYLKSTIPFFLRRPTLLEIRLRMKNPGLTVRFTVARRTDNARIVAGMAYMKSSRLPVSYYMAGFITTFAGNDPVMTGLFDHWFQWCLKNEIRFADFGGFWWKGGDNSWKGLSLFKGKFGPSYFFYPAILFKFRFSWS